MGNMSTTHTLESIDPPATAASTDGDDTKGKKKFRKASKDEAALAETAEALEYYDIDGVLVTVQKSSVNFQLGLYPGGDLVCQLSKRPAEE